jgi:hypothetical protein
MLLVLALVSLGACGAAHPGDAAVVDGRSISMRTLDDTATAYCALTINAAKQQGVDAVSNTDIRRQAVTGLVSLVVARKLAASEDLAIKPSSYQVSTAQRDQIEKAFPSEDVDELVKALEDSQEVTAIAVALAAKATGTAPTEGNQSQLAQAGQQAITSAFRDNDVQFSPRFGLSPSGAARADTGTLAVSPTDLEAPAAEELPDTQRCS